MEASPSIAEPIPPALFVLSGVWQNDEDALYQIFLDTLVKSPVQFQGLRVGIRRHEEYKGKHFAFWHLISEGEKEDERTPDYRRCERLSWVAWIITNCESYSGIVWWENERWGQKHIVIWHETENFAVVLARRNGYFVLKTCYVLKPRRAKDFKTEFAQAIVKKA